MNIVFDCEWNPDGPEVWCICISELDSDIIYCWNYTEVDTGLAFLSKANTIIGHGIITADLPILAKRRNFTYTGNVIDTLVLSRLANPDRRVPFGVNSKAPHSIESWGYRLSCPKVGLDLDFTKWDPEIMERCKQDVVINKRVYEALYKEMSA